MRPQRPDPRKRVRMPLNREAPMFTRVLQGDWQRTAAMLGWALFAAVFLTSSVRALMMPARRVKHLEELPLEEESHE